MLGSPYRENFNRGESMKKLISLVVLMVCVGAAGSAVAAGSVAAGKTKSAACAACHGVDGNSAAPNFPKLAGLDAQYIAKQLADYKSGARKDPLMIGMVAGLSRKDMDDLGAYYASRTRSNDGEIMTRIAFRLSEAEIKAVSEYMAGLR